MKPRNDGNVNPPFNAPKPLPPHSHEDGFHPWCEICIAQREKDRELHPERYYRSPDQGRER
ncbi:MAG: hypothetical protein ACRD3O_00140 [Terriglobia bacterium]